MNTQNAQYMNQDSKIAVPNLMGLLASETLDLITPFKDLGILKTIFLPTDPHL